MQLIIILLIIVIVLLLIRANSVERLLRIYIQKYSEEQKKVYIAQMRYQLIIKLDEKNVLEKFEQSGIKQVFLYGVGNHGKRLLQILEDSTKLEILGFIDGKESVSEYHGKKVYKSSELNRGVLENAKIVVTPIFAYEEIKQQLMDFTEPENIIGLDQII